MNSLILKQYNRLIGRHLILSEISTFKFQDILQLTSSKLVIKSSHNNVNFINIYSILKCKLKKQKIKIPKKQNLKLNNNIKTSILVLNLKKAIFYRLISYLQTYIFQNYMKNSNDNILNLTKTHIQINFESVPFLMFNKSASFKLFFVNYFQYDINFRLQLSFNQQSLSQQMFYLKFFRHLNLRNKLLINS